MSDAPEKVGVHHIRLVLRRQCASARVDSFFAADRALASWASCFPGLLECEFDIVYDDGHTVSGEYGFARQAAGRPALTAFLRRTVLALCRGTGKAPVLRGLAQAPRSFLMQYETQDMGGLETPS